MLKYDGGFSLNEKKKMWFDAAAFKKELKKPSNLNKYLKVTSTAFMQWDIKERKRQKEIKTTSVWHFRPSAHERVVVVDTRTDMCVCVCVFSRNLVRWKFENIVFSLIWMEFICSIYDVFHHVIGKN